MSFSRPTLSELVTRIRTDLSTRLSGSPNALRRQTIGVIATVYAGACYLVYGFIVWCSKQFLPDTAEMEFLIRHGSIKDVTKNPATFCQVTATFTGTDGLTISEGDEMQTNDGRAFTADADATVAAGVATVTATTSVEGDDGNVDVADTLTLSSPIAGINSAGTVATVENTGVDEESDDDYRDRILLRWREVPQGGAEADYLIWAKEVSGVTRVWVKPNYTGPGNVTVFFVRDNDSGSIAPSAGEIADVQDYIDDRRPVTAQLTVLAPTLVARNFTIAVTPDTTAVREAVQAELEDLIERDAEPAGTIYVSRIREAVSRASGETNNIVSSPTIDTTYTAGQIPIMGTITWV